MPQAGAWQAEEPAREIDREIRVMSNAEKFYSLRALEVYIQRSIRFGRVNAFRSKDDKATVKFSVNLQLLDLLNANPLLHPLLDPGIDTTITYDMSYQEVFEWKDINKLFEPPVDRSLMGPSNALNTWVKELAERWSTELAGHLFLSTPTAR